MFLDASLNDLCDVLEGGCILPQVVVAEGYAVAGVCPVALHLEDGVEMSTRLAVSLLLQVV